MSDRPTAALVYDFDGTLSPGSMQEHTLLPAIGYGDSGKFWKKVKSTNKDENGDEILAYMNHLLSVCGDVLSREMFVEHGGQIPLFAGVEDWFDRINEFGSARGLKIEHYVVSSGLEEMIEGCKIRRHFKHVFASKYSYKKNGRPRWPSAAINYTAKTQYLFRINKGVLNNWDDVAVNRWVPMAERPVPFERMIFIGDGDTDIPAMKMVRHQGGVPIAVFDPKQFYGKGSDKVFNLISEERSNHVCPADYTAGSQLDVVVKGVLGRFARDVGYRPK